MKYPALKRALFTGIILSPLCLCSCGNRKQVSAAEFRKEYDWIGKPQSMHTVSYLGEHGGRAYLKRSSMSLVNENVWNDRIISMELSALDPGFRHSLPKQTLSAAP